MEKAVCPLHRLNKTTNNTRLADMGFIKGSIFKIIKKVYGMLQLRLISFQSLDIVIREETLKEMDYERIN